LIASLAAAIDEHEVLATNFLLLNFKLDSFECVDHTHQTLLFHVFGNIILQTAMRVCALSHAVREKKSEVVSDDFEQRHCVLKLCICLTTEATNKVGTQGDARDFGPDSIN
jgi:hypothetical protein